MGSQSLDQRIATHQHIYNLLVQSVAECVMWSSVEEISLARFKKKLRSVSLQAWAAGLSEDDIQTALQVGEGRGRFELA